jgi:hypothetical protein
VPTYEKAHEIDPFNQNLTEDLENVRKRQSSEKMDFPFQIEALIIELFRLILWVSESHIDQS